MARQSTKVGAAEPDAESFRVVMSTIRLSNQLIDRARRQVAALRCVRVDNQTRCSAMRSGNVSSAVIRTCWDAIQNRAVTIVGLLPAGFYNETAVWQAMRFSAVMLDRRGSGTPVIARLRPGRRRYRGRRRRVLTLEVEPLDQTAALRREYYVSLASELRRLPEVVSAGAINHLGLEGGGSWRFPTADTGAHVEGPQHTVLPGYLEAIGVRPH